MGVLWVERCPHRTGEGPTPRPLTVTLFRNSIVNVVRKDEIALEQCESALIILREVGGQKFAMPLVNSGFQFLQHYRKKSMRGLNCPVQMCVVQGSFALADPK